MTTATGHTQAICAKQVIGTNVNDHAGKKIGQVEDVVLDKKSNNIMFAIVSFGGLLRHERQVPPDPLGLARLRRDRQDALQVRTSPRRGPAGRARPRARSRS